MIVVKLGGSFFDSPDLAEWLKVLSEDGAGKLVIVPGGGPFADQVREAQKQHKFNDQIAHKMALHAMDQFGLFLIGMAEKQDQKLIAANSKQQIQEAIKNKQTPVWLPSKELENNKEIPQNWSVTSDSLSAWLAKKINADQLILIKRTNVDSDQSINELEKKNIVDSSLEYFLERVNFKTNYFSAEQYSNIKEMLQKSKAIG